MAIETFEDNFFELDVEPEWTDKVHGWVMGSWVQGGDTGVDNLPIKELTKRTAYLKKQMGIITIPGTFTYSGIQSAAIRAQHRLLDLTGQIISITGTYAALAANVYAGDAANPSAGAFYKCDANGNRTTSGAYMKMPDCRGIFLRGAGSQTRTITWTDAQGVSHSINTLYDGKGIGAFIGDAIRGIRGTVNANGAVAWQLPYGTFYLDEEPSPGPISSGNLPKPTLLVFESSRVAPADSSNHPASISAMICITY